MNVVAIVLVVLLVFLLFNKSEKLTMPYGGHLLKKDINYPNEVGSNIDGYDESLVKLYDYDVHNEHSVE